MAYASAPGWAERLDRIRAGNGTPPPVIRELGLRAGIEGWEPGRVWGRWTLDPRYSNPDGSLFGGYLAALADQALGLVMMTVLDDDSFMTTADLRLSFFRPSLGDVWYEARVVHLGRRSAHVEAEFRDSAGVVLAKASASQAIVRGHVQAPDLGAEVENRLTSPAE